MPPITTILLEGLGYLGTILTLMSMMMYDDTNPG